MARPVFNGKKTVTVVISLREMRIEVLSSNSRVMMPKRRSQSAEYFDLPIDDPLHRQLRDDVWIFGEWIYYLSWLEGENHFDLETCEQDQRLTSYLRKAFPQTLWLVEARNRADMFAFWAKCKYRNSPEGQRYPIKKQTKEELAVALLLEMPSLTDEQIQRRLATTEKQMQRWPLYKLARIEQKRLTPT